MLSKLLRRLFPTYRTRAQLIAENKSLREFCGARDDEPPEMWDTALIIRDLEFERDRLRARVSEVESAAVYAANNYHRVLKRWQHINKNFAYLKPHELCEILIDKLELMRVLPLVSSLRRDHKQRWWITVTINTELGGSKILEDCLRETYNHLGLGRKFHGTKAVR